MTSPLRPVDGDLRVRGDAGDADDAAPPPARYEEPVAGAEPIGAIALAGAGIVGRIIAFGAGLVGGLTLVFLCVGAAFVLTLRESDGVTAAWWAVFGVVVPAAALAGVFVAFAQDTAALWRIALAGFAVPIMPFALIGVLITVCHAVS